MTEEDSWLACTVLVHYRI